MHEPIIMDIKKGYYRLIPVEPYNYAYIEDSFEPFYTALGVNQ